MKLLWLCNMVPTMVREKLDGGKGGGLWVDHVLSDLCREPDLRIHVICRSLSDAEGTVNDRVSFSLFREMNPYPYLPELEERFLRELQAFQPDVVHIWGTEFGHTLAMVNACRRAELLCRTAVSIQGLCSVYTAHYAEGIPYAVQRRSSFRDLIRRDNILRQQKKFAIRGDLETQALRLAEHVIGRTDWDRACTDMIHPGVNYHHCCETLRDEFYYGAWRYGSCRKHRIFASSCTYPIKGFHYLLEAFAEILKTYPDATLAVPGSSFLVTDFKGKLLRQTYHGYLAELVERYGIGDKIEFLGSLNGEEMKQAFLEANAFVLPSTIENSPNSLGEAMLLGAPCVAADVGGVTNMMTHGTEGYVYQSTAPYMLAHYVKEIFAMEDGAEALGEAARGHARLTHDPDKNLCDLLEIYRELAEQK